MRPGPFGSLARHASEALAKDALVKQLHGKSAESVEKHLSMLRLDQLLFTSCSSFEGSSAWRRLTEMPRPGRS